MPQRAGNRKDIKRTQKGKKLDESRRGLAHGVAIRNTALLFWKAKRRLGHGGWEGGNMNVSRSGGGKHDTAAL